MRAEPIQPESDILPAKNVASFSSPVATLLLFLLPAMSLTLNDVADVARFFAVFGGIGSQLCGSRSLPAMR
jgi:hypothetical protein